jgi:hypothetical protein
MLIICIYIDIHIHMHINAHDYIYIRFDFFVFKHICAFLYIGKHDAGGLWPAMWLLGNMARATYVGSSNNVWPWSYNSCAKGAQSQQRFSACNRVNHYDLHPYQGIYALIYIYIYTLSCIYVFIYV